MKNFLSKWLSNFTSYLTPSTSSKFASFMDGSDLTQQLKNRDLPKFEQLKQSITQILKSELSSSPFTKQIALLSDFTTYFLQFKQCQINNDYSSSFTHLSNSFAMISELFTIDQMVFGPIIKYIIKNLYSASIKSKDEKSISDCGRLFISFFSKWQMSDDKTLVFFVVVFLMKIYFKLKTYRNSLTLVNWYEKSDVQSEEIPQSENATFSFYQGRLSLYELKLAEARDVLNKAFIIAINSKTSSAKHNVQLIYEYLIPINLFFFIYTKQNSFDIDPNYNSLTQSVLNGDVGQFITAIDSLEERTIALGTFLIVGKLKPFVFRNLIKNVYYSQIEVIEAMKAPFMKLENILKVMKNVYHYEDDMDLEELELNVIGVIYRGLIGGYVHNADKVIVFSKKNPFPELGGVMKNNYSKII